MLSLALNFLDDVMFLILLVTDLVLLRHLLTGAIGMHGASVSKTEQEPNLLLERYITHASPLKNQIEQRHVWKSWLHCTVSWIVTKYCCFFSSINWITTLNWNQKQAMMLNSNEARQVYVAHFAQRLYKVRYITKRKRNKDKSVNIKGFKTSKWNNKKKNLEIGTPAELNV